MGFVIGLGTRDPQHAHIVVYSCRGAFKISKIPGSGPNLRFQVPKMKNFKKSRKITFSKLAWEPFLCIPYALWELGDTPKHVSHHFRLLPSLGSETAGVHANYDKKLKHCPESFLAKLIGCFKRIYSNSTLPAALPGPAGLDLVAPLGALRRSA